MSSHSANKIFSDILVSTLRLPHSENFPVSVLSFLRYDAPDDYVTLAQSRTPPHSTVLSAPISTAQPNSSLMLPFWHSKYRYAGSVLPCLHAHTHTHAHTRTHTQTHTHTRQLQYCTISPKTLPQLLSPPTPIFAIPFAARIIIPLISWKFIKRLVYHWPSLISPQYFYSVPNLRSRHATTNTCQCTYLHSTGYLCSVHLFVARNDTKFFLKCAFCAIPLPFPRHFKVAATLTFTFISALSV